LDDVGSAYSSLLRLKDLPVDEIKLDQGFIRSLEQRPQDLHFVGAIQDLAAGMGVDLVVEGVETEDILDAIIVTGAQFLQGYAIAKPMPLSELQAFLQRPPLPWSPASNQSAWVLCQTNRHP
ncbi:EAL domain-containing protein, partial [Acidithiobacillus ferridurans]|uniref:EAL domain-containing protein n=1 Tax=Acidithiobacillus ferridurans TaxID=1232575 RepID=UPI001D0206F7